MCLDDARADLKRRMLREMRERTGSVLLVGLLLGCSPDPGSTFHTRRASVGSDAAGANADASRGGASDGGSTLTCPAACPLTEPAEGDPCDLWEQCEYGEDPLLECNRVYFCSLGVFQKWKFNDASVCVPGLASGCPATRASVTVGGACRSEGLRCAYMEGECDCAQGLWHCFPDNPQLGVAHCTFPRPRLSTACSPQSDRCEYEPICQAEACSACGKWEMVPFACSTAPPMTDGGTLPDAAPAPDGGAALDGGPPRDGGAKPDGQAKPDGGTDAGH